MGWFSRWVKKVVEPVKTYVIEPIIEVVVEPVVEVTTSVVSAVTNVVSTTIDIVTTHVVEPIVSTATDLVQEATSYLIENAPTIGLALADVVLKYASPVAYDAIANYVDSQTHLDEDDYAHVLPVEGAVLKTHEQFDVEDWTADDLTMIRDTVALTQVAFADFSDLFSNGNHIVNELGYVLDEAALYDYYDWHTGIETWMQERFEVIRVQEATLSPLFQANVTLFEDKIEGGYSIGIGGTSGLEDIVTDVVLALLGTTPGKSSITHIIDDFFTNDIVGGTDAYVSLMGVSLGGAEALLQYHETPDLFDDLFLLNSAGIGGVAGTYYDRNVWGALGDAKMGDANITEISVENDGTDFDDFVTSLGHVGAGQTYFMEDIIFSSESNLNLEFAKSHLNGNVWATLPGGEYPDLPVETPTDDAFVFV